MGGFWSPIRIGQRVFDQVKVLELLDCGWSGLVTPKTPESRRLPRKNRGHGQPLKGGMVF